MTKAILDRQSRAGLGILIALGVQGCVFRLHDPGLMESSAEAGRVIAEVREPAGSAFSAMEANLAAVSSSGEKLTALENDLEQVTFLRVLPDLTSEEILERLTESVDEHLSAGDSIARGVKEATRSIESELVRQKLLEPTDPRDLASLAKKANERWADLLGIADKVGLDASDSELKEAIGSVLGAPADDPRVKDAKVLLTQVVSDVARADAARMEELRRYAKAVELIQSDWKERTENWTATLAIVAPLVDPQEYKVLRGRLQIVETCARVQPNRASPEACQALLENLEESQKCEGSVDPQVAQDIFSEFSQAVEDLADWGALQARYALSWTDEMSTLASYVERTLASEPEEQRQAAPKGIAALGILLFVEAPQDRAARLNVAAESHRHSIRLSAINADQRLDLVQRIAEGLAIYHRGGIKSEELARLILSAGEVGALIGIGAKL